jgi:transposase
LPTGGTNGCRHASLPELPKYAPELNDIELVWRDLKAHHLAHQTFADADALNQAIHQAVRTLNDERIAYPLAELRIFA